LELFWQAWAVLDVFPRNGKYICSLISASQFMPQVCGDAQILLPTAEELFPANVTRSIAGAGTYTEVVCSAGKSFYKHGCFSKEGNAGCKTAV
jgi:hypothetical protein